MRLLALVLAAVALGGCMNASFDVWVNNDTDRSAVVTVVILDESGTERFNETIEAAASGTTYLTEKELKFSKGLYTVIAWVDGKSATDSRTFNESLGGIGVELGSAGHRIVFYVN